MLFFMGSASHLAWLDDGSNLLSYWLVAGGLIVLVEINGLIGPGLATQKPLGSVKGTIHAGLGLTLVLFLIGVFINSSSLA